MGRIFDPGENRMSTTEWKRRRDQRSGGSPRRAQPSGHKQSAGQQPSRNPIWGVIGLVSLVAIFIGIVTDDDEVRMCTSYETQWRLGNADTQSDLRYESCGTPDGDLTTVGDWFE